jgi:four helix bundle protein
MYREFEDLPIYQEALAVSEQMFGLARTSAIRRDFSMADQFRRAIISITNNIAEGFERDSNKEFRYFLRVAKGSAGEARSILHLAFRLQYISAEEHEHCCDLMRTVSRQLAGFIRYLNDR